MKNIENKVNKVCSFYINEWHLTTMILPYINKSIKEDRQILTIMENGIKEQIEELLSRMNLNQNTQEEILNIDWTTTAVCKYNKIKEELETKLRNSEKLNIIINGTREYIEIANKNMYKAIENLKFKEITIINCYDITKESNVKDILNKHEFVLNTSGINKIEDAFKDYKSEEKIAE